MLSNLEADCSSFRSFEEFCRERKPWGLGYDIEILNQIVQERLDRQRAERLEKVPEDGRANKDREVTTGRFISSPHDYHNVNHGKNSEVVINSRLRAIKRAPPIVGTGQADIQVFAYSCVMQIIAE